MVPIIALEFLSEKQDDSRVLKGRNEIECITFDYIHEEIIFLNSDN